MRKALILTLGVSFLFVNSCLCNEHSEGDKEIDKITRFCSTFIYPYLQESAQKEFEDKKFTPQQTKLLTFPRTQFYTTQSEQITLEVTKHFEGKSVTKNIIHSFILKKYRAVFPSLKEEVFIKLSQELKNQE